MKTEALNVRGTGNRSCLLDSFPARSVLKHSAAATGIGDARFSQSSLNTIKVFMSLTAIKR